MAAPARAHSRAPWARAHTRTSPESRRPRQQQQPRAPLAHTPHRVRRRPARRACAVAASGGREGEGAEPEANDLASKLARLIFGGNALNDMEPAGLKRMTKEEWPDQWPPVTDAFAAAVEGDCEEVAAFRPLLKQTQLEFQPLALLYDAQRDGWTEEDFHRRVDGMGACVLVAETDEGTCFGGYNPKGWLGTSLASTLDLVGPPFGVPLSDFALALPACTKRSHAAAHRRATQRFSLKSGD